MSKDLTTERALNEHRFRASIGVQVPMRVITLDAMNSNDAFAECASIVKELSGGKFGYMWCAPDGCAGWMCSWG